MLRLYHPITGIEMEWHAPLPDDGRTYSRTKVDAEQFKDEMDW